MNDFNAQIIEEFRANEGRVAGPFEGAPMVLVHNVGRRSGDPHVSPMMYLAGDTGVTYVFASKAGAPTSPDWYYNLVAAGTAEIEVGTETFPVAVSEETGAERDWIYAEQARLYPGFAEYRTIPVLRLTRTA
jgi:deazaflavin-dependent oxidoreductase (nitroreductase family)